MSRRGLAAAFLVALAAALWLFATTGPDAAERERPGDAAPVEPEGPGLRGVAGLPASGSPAGVPRQITPAIQGADAPGGVTVTVLRFDGQPAVGALVEIQPRGGTRASAATDARGRVRLARLSVGTVCELAIHPYHAGVDLAPWHDEAWKAQAGTLVLAQAWRVSGVVQDERGEPCRDCHVLYRQPASRFWLAAHVAADGGFQIGTLQDAPVHLRAVLGGRAAGADPRAGLLPRGAAEADPIGTRVVQPDTRDVVLRVVRGGALKLFLDGWDAETGIPLRVRAQGQAAVRRVEVPDSGVVEVFELGAGVLHDVWLYNIPGGFYVEEQDLPARPTAQQQRVVVKAGGRIEVRIPPAGPGGGLRGVTVQARDASGRIAQGRARRRDLAAGDRRTALVFWLSGLPTRTWRVEARGHRTARDGTWVPVTGHLDAAPGETVTLELTTR